MKLVRSLCLSLVLVLLAQMSLAAAPRHLGQRTFTYQNSNWRQTDADGSEYQVNPRVITVKLLPSTSRAAADRLHHDLDASVLRRARTGFIDVRIATGKDVFTAVDEYLASGLVELAEPNTFGTYTIVPDDTNYGSQWHPAKVEAETAWETTAGSPNAVIAVLDSGSEFSHPDLGTGTDGYQNVWLNAGEDAWSDVNDPTTGDGIDNDMNGYTDDWKGYDFSTGNNNGEGSFFHGTAVAGVSAAKTNNGRGVAGIAGGWNSAGARIMVAGVGESFPNGAALDDAILYAAAEGADVVQLSLAVGQSAAIDAAVQMAYDDFDLTIICASGNGSAAAVTYPSSLPRIIAVGATTQSDARSDFSNYGPDVELAAPGSGIWTLDLGGGYTTSSGTSFSAPLVSGVVALMLSADPSLSNTEIRQILRDTAVKVGGYDYNWNAGMPGHSQELGYGRVDANAAVQASLSDSLVFDDGFESGDAGVWTSSLGI